MRRATLNATVSKEIFVNETTKEIRWFNWETSEREFCLFSDLLGLRDEAEAYEACEYIREMLDDAKIILV